MSLSFNVVINENEVESQLNNDSNVEEEIDKLFEPATPANYERKKKTK